MVAQSQVQAAESIQFVVFFLAKRIIPIKCWKRILLVLQEKLPRQAIAYFFK
jgi:hypothetical protein